MEAAELIGEIVADPEDLAAWTIYADWLLDRGDVRGEVINLALAIEQGASDPAVTRRFRDLHTKKRMLSPRLLPHVYYWDIELWRGFLRRVSLHPTREWAGREAIAALFEDPHAGLLAELTVRDIGDDLAPMFDARPPSLRVLEIDLLGALATRLDDLPQLAELRLDDPRFDWAGAAEDNDANDDDDDDDDDDPTALRVPATDPAPSHRALRRLVGRTSACPWATSGALQVPALEELVWSVDDDDPIWADSRSILHHPPASLRRLELTSKRESFYVGALAGIARTAAARQATALQLRSLDEGDIEPLLEAAPELARLAALTFEFSRIVYDPDAQEAREIDTPTRQRLAEALERALPNARVECDRIHPDDLPREPRGPSPYDEMSRGPNGRVDAVGAFGRGRGE